MVQKKSHAEYDRERNALAAAYEDASESVCDLLYSHAAQDVTLALNGALYNGASLRKLALLIANKKILSFIDPAGADISPGSEAEYLQDIDTILLRHQPTDPYTKSAVLHECIHAINDMNRLDITNANNEKHAYIFQALYLRKLNFTGNIILAGTTQDLRFPPAAFDIADRIRENRYVSLDSVMQLEATLRSNTEYAKLAAKSPNDGIRK